MYKLIIFFIFLPCLAFAGSQDSVVAVVQHNILQELKQNHPHQGRVQLHTSPSIDNLLRLHIHNNQRTKNFTGYRIQIYSANSYGCNVEQLKEMRNKFEEAFQDIPAYLKYFDPDFKIRVGNFHSRLESIPTLHRVRKLYPASYPVKTEITLDDLKRIPMQDVVKEETETVLPPQ